MSILRDITPKIEKKMGTDEILLLLGARQAGKTTILKQLQSNAEKEGHSTHYIDLEDPDYLKRLNESPKNLFHLLPLDLTKRQIVFLDEIQYLDDPTRFLKYLYDEYRGKIKLVVTGSSSFYIDQKFKDSLAGRKEIFNIRTLSFREFLRFKGSEDLAASSFANPPLTIREKLILLYKEYMTYGGYPRVVLAPLEEKVDLLRELAYSYVKKDVLESGIRRDDLFFQLIKLLAAQIGQLVNFNEIGATLGISRPMVTHHCLVMERSFHLHFIRPFFRNVRKELTRTPKVYFYDLGMRNFFLQNFKPFDLREDRGGLLENAAFRQFLEFLPLENIHFWRTSQQHEIDFVLGDQRAIEIKVNKDKGEKKNQEVFQGFYPDIPVQTAVLDRESSPIKHAIDVWSLESL